MLNKMEVRMSKPKDKKPLKHKERNKRVGKEEVDILEYEALVWKIICKEAAGKGNWVYDYKEELKQLGFMALMSAHNSYDPTKGTFITIAWLRVSTHIGRFLRKQAIYFSSINHLEDLSFTTGSNEAISWQDLFASSEIDLNVIIRLAVNKEDDIDWLIVHLLMTGCNRREFPRELGLSHTETKERIAALRENLVSVCNEIYQAQ
jgi:hypothetical protein